MIIKIVSRLLSIRYSIFSIVFLFSTLLLALTFPTITMNLSWITGMKILLIGGIAVMFARTTGIVVNQIIDINIDKKNPRTSSRLLPTQTLSLRLCILLVALTSCLFVFLSFLFSRGCGRLSLLSVLVMVIYPYTKRFTYFCHWVLGGVYYLAILMVFHALSIVTPSMLFAASLWGMTVGMIIAGNDIIYALQDIEFDRKERLYSIPSCFGEKTAICIASCCLCLSFISYLCLLFYLSYASWVYVLACFPLIAIVRMVRSYTKLHKNKEAERCFFLGNLYLSLSFFVAMLLLLVSKI